MEFKCPIVNCEQRIEIGARDKISDIEAKVRKHIENTHSIEEMLQTPPFNNETIMQKNASNLKHLNGFIVVQIPISVDFDIKRR